MYIRGHSSQKMGDFFMEENYLIQSKIYTKAIVTIMEKVLKNKSADILDYYGLFSNWLSWFHLNDPMYENLSDPNKGEHLEVTLTKLRMSLPGFEVCAKALLKDVRSIISLYRSNAEFFSSLYEKQNALRDMMWAHVNELDKTYDPVMADLAMRRKVDSELERLLCMYRHDTRAYLKALDDLETKYVVTIDPDNPDYWFKVSEDVYKEHDKKYNAFLTYKGHCLTSVSSNYVESACMTAERIYEVLSKEIMDDSELKTVPEVETSSAIKVYLNGDVCQSFYRSGAVGHIFKNCNEELFYQLMNLNFPAPGTVLKLTYTDGLYYMLNVLKDFLLDEEDTQDWITEILTYFNKKYDTYKGHYTDVIGDSGNEKSVAFKLYPIIKDWLKLRN